MEIINPVARSVDIAPLSGAIAPLDRGSIVKPCRPPSQPDQMGAGAAWSRNFVTGNLRRSFVDSNLGVEEFSRSLAKHNGFHAIALAKRRERGGLDGLKRNSITWLVARLNVFEKFGEFGRA